MPNYIDVLANCFPEAQAVVRGGADPTVYANLEWITAPIPQATLDASECAIKLNENPDAVFANEVSYADAFGQVLIEKFSKVSNGKNVWLSHNGKPSNNNPSIIPFNGKLVGVAFSNDRSNASTDIEIYITPPNSTTAELVYVWEFRNGKKGYNNLATQTTFDAGSKVGVYLRNAGKSPKNIDVTVYLQVIDAIPTEHIE